MRRTTLIREAQYAVRARVLDALEGFSRYTAVFGACGVERSASEISKSGRQVVANGTFKRGSGMDRSASENGVQ